MKVNNETDLIVIDFETLGTDIDSAPILSLGVVIGSIDGAVKFEKEFYFNLKEQMRFSDIDADTVNFWIKEDNIKEFRQLMQTCLGKEVPIRDTISVIDHTINMHTKSTNRLLVGNSPDFDNKLLDRLYYSESIPFDFNYDQHFDFRTCRKLFELANLTIPSPLNDNLHNALADAQWEYKMLVNYIDAVKESDIPF